jgi:quercetin dioxygenase-like cupin family protein
VKPARRPLARLEEQSAVEGPTGILRTTLAFDEQAMVCHFRMARGAVIPPHSHPAVQAGYVMAGRVRFQRGGDGDGFVATPGTSYVFEANEPHGATVLEEALVIECFAPARPEYA